MPSVWETLSSRKLFEYMFIRVMEYTRRSPRTERTGSFFAIETVDWVNVIPVTREGKIVLVEQYRHGSDGITLEFPAGGVDPGEDPMDAGLRELAEETGYIAETLTDLGWNYPNPAFQANRCFVYLAEGCSRDATQKFDEWEDITLREVTFEELLDLAQSGKFRHAIALASLGQLYARGLAGGLQSSPSAS